MLTFFFPFSNVIKKKKRNKERERERDPLKEKWHPTPVFLLREYHGQRSLVGYRPRGCKELDMTECLNTHTLSRHWPFLLTLFRISALSFFHSALCHPLGASKTLSLSLHTSWCSFFSHF